MQFNSDDRVVELIPLAIVGRHQLPAVFSMTASS